jgi:hypothetical protein
MMSLGILLSRHWLNTLKTLYMPSVKVGNNVQTISYEVFSELHSMPLVTNQYARPTTALNHTNSTNSVISLDSCKCT